MYNNAQLTLRVYKDLVAICPFFSKLVAATCTCLYYHVV